MRARPLLLFCFAALGTGCAGLELGAGAAYMHASAEGNVALGPGTGPARIEERPNSVDDHLGVDDAPSLYVFTDAVQDRWRWQLSAFRFSQTGSGRLPNPFGDIAATSPVDADLDFLNARGVLTYDAYRQDYFELAAGIAANYYDWDLDVHAQAYSQRESLRSEVLVPMPYLRATAREQSVAASVGFGAMGGDFGDGDGTWIDFEAQLSYRPQDNVELLGGYRLTRVDGDGVVDGQAYKADLEVSGWFVGGAFHFGFARPERSLH